jgi:molybdopterin adenylyltransferase
MSQSVEEHRGTSPTALQCGVITVSDTRTLATDTGGAELIRLLESAGHTVLLREIVRDEPQIIQQLITAWSQQTSLDCILLTGGTGISSRDQTYETISQLLTKPLPGYGELFRMLSFAEIGAAAMLSRAIGGLCGNKILLTMPGSPHAVRLAMEKLILPEIKHLVREARR